MVFFNKKTNKSNSDSVNQEFDSNTTIPSGTLEKAELKLIDRNSTQSKTDPLMVSDNRENTEQKFSTDWIDDDLTVKNNSRPKRVTLLDKLLIGAGLLFMVMLSISIYIWMTEVNVIDPEKVITRSVSPTEIVAGEIQDLKLIIENSNEVAMMNSRLKTFYPEASNNGKSDNIVEQEIGFIGPGQTKEITIPYLLLGQVDNEYDIKFELTYSVPDVMNEFVLEFNKKLTVDKMLVQIKPQLPNEVVAGDRSNFSLIMTSSKLLENLELKVSAGEGYDITSDQLYVGSGNEIVVPIKMISPENPLSISGDLFLTGVTSDLGNLRFEVKNESYKMLMQDVDFKIVLPPVMIEFDLDDNYYQNKTGRYVVELTNTTNEVITDLTVKVQVDNMAEVSAFDGGVVDKQNQITFNSERSSRLKLIEPGDATDLEFSGTPIDSSLHNIQVVVTGFSSRSVTAQTLAAQTTTVPVKPAFSARANTFYNQGSFANKGPIPPRVDEVTNYTIMLETDIIEGSVKLDRLTANIPSYVTILDKGSGSVNIDGNELVWKNPKVKDKLELQVSLEPDATMIGQEVKLLELLKLSYEKSGKELDYNLISPTTSLDEPNSRPLNGLVVE